jgi:tetratricopeptide (TPR) repeat protein
MPHDRPGLRFVPSGPRAPPLGAAVMATALWALLTTAANAALGGEEPRQLSNERTMCTGRPDTPWDRQISSCTALIQSDRETELNRTIAYNNRAIAYFGKQDYARAVADYDQAVRLNPDYAFAYYNRGNAYQAKGDNDRAILDYDKALALQPTMSAAARTQGGSRCRRGAGGPRHDALVGTG